MEEEIGKGNREGRTRNGGIFKIRNLLNGESLKQGMC